MNLSDSQKKSIFFFIIGVFIICLLFFSLNTNEKTIVNFFTLFGTFLSLFGLGLAYQQILSIKLINQSTSLAVNESLKRINKIISVSDLSKANKIIQEIQESNLNSKPELSLMRMKDLKHIMIQIKYNEDLNEYTKAGIYVKNITDLSIDIKNLSTFILGNKRAVNFATLNNNLETLSTTLCEFENKLKFETND